MATMFAFRARSRRWSPLFDLLRQMGLVNNPLGPRAHGLSVRRPKWRAVSFLRNFIEDIPKELFRAAQIDGAGHFQQIYNIVLSASRLRSFPGHLHHGTSYGSWNNVIPDVAAAAGRRAASTISRLVFSASTGEYVKANTASSWPASPSARFPC